MEMGENSFYLILNRALISENHPSLKPWYLYLKLFDNALQKLPSQKMIVWRGIRKDVTKNFKKNDVVTWWSVNSCSAPINIIKNFLDLHSTLFLIECINALLGKYDAHAIAV
ncbi:unnamed protein product [Didymodactylos carnosus]|uniref:Uncharacterized protein n=1 Tax=Didymodactylos carnosus TaxID=1234261 RepID=A0A815D8F0_9BILA|nr:unnamed protein product [Didymodactylos carnosus]CAF4116342.1 unnamed protein product [Didymodactylos carnosus]